MGFVGYGTASQAIQLVALAPSNPTRGTGPLFGIELQPVAVDILTAPSPTHPVRVTADADGNYVRGLPSGIVPVGLVLDVVSVELPAGASTIGFVSEVEGVVF